MSTSANLAPGASGASRQARPVQVNRPSPVAVGTIVWLASELMFFAGIFAMYFSTRAALMADGSWAEGPAHLNVPQAFLITVVLVSSSVTCQMAVFKAEAYQARRTGPLWDVKHWGMEEWLTLTFLLGAFFIAGQVTEYAELVQHGLTIASSAYGSVFYYATGFHGIHVIAGLIAMLFVLGRSFMAKRFGHHEATTTIVVSYYWHFVDVVWLFLFAVIYFLH